MLLLRSREFIFGKTSMKSCKMDMVGTSVMNKFKEQLVLRYGSLSNAWRYSLDVEGDGKIPFTKFCRVARELNFTRSVKQLWRQLDVHQTGFITLSSLDEAASPE
ncbi:hypothetical protein Pmar_PMAR023413 [Perkinsus marinus ATCC 50983]|uniref:EF-hand domain-containing protein n=1 Tax=Perkinsus marinus (strain ATCC 50983 / TXsc) TaxID=423536 RepID=C5KKH6_PERM5|nr:hypothetical protein Pmar_PMAR023413 [Perkinsus marinus ATCC 50983]EER15088.1 hypothetical protein Pmar_PMAR023413 [Perkinsus marinus ATCC 50983]|eukprot:XP_002783292.1 hypothetical protein Pmar_PMAR023413 [Perkinsus marinus ATCC 50983]